MAGRVSRNAGQKDGAHVAHGDDRRIHVGRRRGVCLVGCVGEYVELISVNHVRNGERKIGPARSDLRPVHDPERPFPDRMIRDSRVRRVCVSRVRAEIPDQRQVIGGCEKNRCRETDQKQAHLHLCFGFGAEPSGTETSPSTGIVP